MKKILVFRFSAMGDVVLTVPVLHSLVTAYPDLEVIVVTRPRFGTFFKHISKVSLLEADVDLEFSGILGLWKLFRRILQTYPDVDALFDLHDNLRTTLIRSFFAFSGKRVYVFKKGRKEKRAFSRPHHKITTPLPHTVSRYYEVFKRAGLSFPLLSPPYLIPLAESNRAVEEWLQKMNVKKNEKWIGLAPFALHKSKIWPLNNYSEFMRICIAQGPVKFFFFGGGKNEVEFFEGLKKDFPEKCVVVAGQLTLNQEISLITRLNIMVCTDSSNMHLSALAGIPVLSIWGGTHPEVGFAPFGKGEESILQVSRHELPCRPCSVYGKETCFRKDFACLNNITPRMVADSVLAMITS